MRVVMDAVTLASIHSLGIGVSNEKDVAPVITQIALKREGDDLRAVATDRYVVITGLYKNYRFERWEEGQEILVDPKRLKRVLDIMKETKESAVSIYSGDDGKSFALLKDNTAVSVKGEGNLGSFPPVMNLFPSNEPTGAGALNLRPDFLAKLAKVLPPVAKPERYRTWRFEFRSVGGYPSKPQPVYAQYSDGTDYTLEALIQPALDKRA